MYKQLLVLFLIVVVVKSQNYNSTLRTEDYINQNRRQHASVLYEFDLQMERFKANYAALLNTIDIQLNLLEGNLKQSDERLDALQVLSYCVSKYRTLVPTMSWVKTTIDTCIATAANQITTLLANPLSVRSNLEYYFTNSFETYIKNCKINYGSVPLNYTMCIMDRCSTTNDYVASSQKDFATYMDASQCTGNANVKQAIDCSFVVQNSTIASTAEANTLINRCLLGLDDCSSCNKNYYCSEVKYMAKSQVDYYSSTMANPLLGQNQSSDCLMLKLY